MILPKNRQLFAMVLKIFGSILAKYFEEIKKFRLQRLFNFYINFSKKKLLYFPLKLGLDLLSKVFLLNVYKSAYIIYKLGEARVAGNSFRSVLAIFKY